METNWKFILQETETQYYCILCGCDVLGIQNVKDHYGGTHHADALELYGSDISYSENNLYYCQLCECYISGYINVRSHIKGQRHQDFLYESESDTSEESLEYVAMKTDDFIIPYVDCDKFLCFLCDEDITSEWNVTRHLWSKNHKNAVEIYGRDILRNGNTWYYCKLCDCSIPSYKNIHEHVTGKKHDDFLDE